MKEYFNNKDRSSVIIYEKKDRWFYKHVTKGRWMKKASEVGPYSNQGEAFLALCLSTKLKFSEFTQVSQ